MSGHGHSHNGAPCHGHGHSHAASPAMGTMPGDMTQEQIIAMMRQQQQQHLGSPVMLQPQRPPELTVFQLAQRGMLPELQDVAKAGTFDPNGRDGEDITCLHWAAINNRMPLVRSVPARRPPRSPVDGCRRVPFSGPGPFPALRRSRCKVAPLHGNSYLLDLGAEVDPTGGELNATPLHWAVRQGHLSMVTLLMSRGADPAVKDNQGFNTLHIAAQFGHT